MTLFYFTGRSQVMSKWIVGSAIRTQLFPMGTETAGIVHAATSIMAFRRYWHYVMRLVKDMIFLCITCIYLITVENTLKFNLLWSQSWVVSSHYSSFQRHMIRQKSADLIPKKHFLLLSSISVKTSCAA